MDYDVELKVNGQVIPLNYFVKRMYLNIVNSMVDSLDEIPENKDKIEIIIKEK